MGGTKDAPREEDATRLVEDPAERVTLCRAGVRSLAHPDLDRPFLLVRVHARTLQDTNRSVFLLY